MIIAKLLFHISPLVFFAIAILFDTVQAFSLLLIVILACQQISIFQLEQKKLTLSQIDLSYTLG